MTAPCFAHRIELMLNNRQRTSRGSYLDHNQHPQDLANSHGLQLQDCMEAELA